MPSVSQILSVWSLFRLLHLGRFVSLIVAKHTEPLIGSIPSFTGCTVTAEFHRRPLPQLYVEALAPVSDPRLLTIMVDQGTYRNMNDFSCSAVKVLADADSLKTHVPILSIYSSVCKLSGKNYSVPRAAIVDHTFGRHSRGLDSGDWLRCNSTRIQSPNDELSRRRRYVPFHGRSNLDLSSRVSNLVGGQRPAAYRISAIPRWHQEMQRGRPHWASGVGKS